MEQRALLLVLAFALDMVMGDPENLWHPVRSMGSCIQWLEPRLRRIFSQTKGGERLAGLVLVIIMTGLWGGLCYGLLQGWRSAVGDTVAFVLEVLICGQLLATRSLYQESMAVYTQLQQGTLATARQQVARIVGRDTAELDAPGITRATVETVAENFCDGVLAPMLFILIGGAPGVMVYKAVNTMDSMVGYQNDRYRHFGTAAAKVDDLLNFAPARIGGLMMALLSTLAGLDMQKALQVFFRDRYNHKSPNSAHTEAAMAGALGVQLGGNGYYGGKLVEKPTIGDALRPIDPMDIVHANKLMLLTALACVAGVGFGLALL